jgi:D-sedoheptulose 7-phosphate isomerase
LSCFANDFGYDHWVEKSIEFYANPGDIVILISSSGNSMNMVNGAKQSKKMGLITYTLSGFKEDNKLRQLGDENLYIKDERYNYVEMAHNIWLLAIVDYIITHY